MPDDDITETLLTDYESTAENLQHGVNVSQETMNRYHGMTGMLLARCVRSLWTQKQLDDQIDIRMAERCKVCPNSQFIERLKAGDVTGLSFKGVALQNARLIIICVTVIVSALATRSLPNVGDIVKAVVPAVLTAPTDADGGAK